MNLDAITSYRFSTLETEYTFKDSILYALGLGYGSDPLNADELRFVTEDDQRVVPTQCNVLAYPGFWARDIAAFEIDWVKIVHGEQWIEILKPLPPAAKIKADHKISAIDDKGKEKGAILYFDREISLAESGEILARVRSTIFARGDGGQGGFGEFPASPSAINSDQPEAVFELPTSRRSALIYRLSGDFNPLHSNPEVAKAAGFERPILHGMCTMGIACRAILESYCDNRPEKLKSMFVRFSNPVLPGDTLRVEFFQEGGDLRFRAIAVERNVVVLDRCSAEIAA